MQNPDTASVRNCFLPTVQHNFFTPALNPRVTADNGCHQFPVFELETCQSSFHIDLTNVRYNLDLGISVHSGIFHPNIPVFEMK